jgi:hypothetical protein
LSQRPDEWDGDGLESESESDDDDDPDRADPVGLGRVLEQLLDVTATCVPADMEQALRDVQVVAKRLVDLGDVGKYVAERKLKVCGDGWEPGLADVSAKAFRAWWFGAVRAQATAALHAIGFMAKECGVALDAGGRFG